MSKRHDAIFDDVLSGLGAPEAKSALPRENRFLRRSSALAERASGAILEKTLRWVDPARCRMWARHNRRYDLLDAANCADLIEGIRAQGGQEFPAIVRALRDDPEHEYEVICGARRHWAVSWLNANNYPQFRFLVEVRALTDEEAFRLADIENRDRRDISDYERAVDYDAACRRYYDGHQGRMAERLEVSDAWLSRYLDLARLPDEVVRAYGDLSGLREFHARKLKPLLASAGTRTAVLREARRLADLQAGRKADGGAPIAGPRVLSALLAAAQAAGRAGDGPAALKAAWTGADGASVRASARGEHVTLVIRSPAAVDQQHLDLLVRQVGGHLHPAGD